MALTTQAQLLGALASGQQIQFAKAGPAVAQFNWGTYFDQGIAPPAGTLAAGNTANGVVPTDATTGCPVINNFAAGNTGYLGSVVFGSVSIGTAGGGRLRVADMLFKAGAYSFNANVMLTAQPSYSGRVPNGDYKGLEIWIETVTSFTGVPTITVTYTNQDGTTGRSTGATAMPAALAARRMYQMRLQAGDTGVQKIESVVCTVATVGTFNVLVLRPLWMGRLHNNGLEDFHFADRAKLPIVFDSSALILMGTSENSSGNLLLPEILLNVINL